MLARFVRRAPEVLPRGFRGKRAHLRLQVFQIGAGEGKDFHIAVPINLALLRAMFFQNTMKIGAAESQRAHAGAARMRRMGKPGALAGVDVKGGTTGRRAFQGLRDLDGRGDDFLVKRHRRLDDARDACSRLGVADLRFHRAKGAPGAVLFCGLKHFRQGGQFRGIPDFGAGAMGFNHADRLRRHAGEFIGALQRQFLSIRARRVDGTAASVARRCGALEHREYAVTVTFGVLQALEYQHAQPFAQDGSIAISIERLGIPGGRQRRRLGKAHVHEDVVEGVDTPGDHHVRTAGGKFKAGQMDRRE